MASLKLYSGIRGVLLLVVCLAIVNLAVGQQRICGHNLRNVIEMMCPNGVNGYKTKRGGSLSLDDELSNESPEGDLNFGLEFDMLPFLNEMENNGIAHIRRRRQGIAHECCDKPCHTSEILKYCRK